MCVGQAIGRRPGLGRLGPFSLSLSTAAASVRGNFLKPHVKTKADPSSYGGLQEHCGLSGWKKHNKNEDVVHTGECLAMCQLIFGAQQWQAFVPCAEEYLGHSNRQLSCAPYDVNSEALSTTAETLCFLKVNIIFVKKQNLFFFVT